MRHTASAATLLVGLLAAATGAPAAATQQTCGGLSPTVAKHAGQITGTAGPDVIMATGRAQIKALGGDDVICGSPARDLISAGAGSDVVYAGGGPDQITGGPGSDLLVGQAGADEIWGGAGHDVLVGADGADVLRGGAGADSIYAGAGPDRVSGGRGADVTNNDRYALVISVPISEMSWMRASQASFTVSQDVAVNHWPASATPTASTAWAVLDSPLAFNVVTWGSETALYSTARAVPPASVPQVARYLSPAELGTRYGYSYSPWYAEAYNRFSETGPAGDPPDSYNVGIAHLDVPGSLGIARKVSVSGVELGWSPLVNEPIDRLANVYFRPTNVLRLMVRTDRPQLGQLIDTYRATDVPLPTAGSLAVTYSQGAFVVQP